jgi:hypothetical protein
MRQDYGIGRGTAGCTAGLPVLQGHSCRKSTTFGGKTGNFCFIPKVQTDGNLQEISDFELEFKAATCSPAIQLLATGRSSISMVKVQQGTVDYLRKGSNREI